MKKLIKKLLRENLERRVIYSGVFLYDDREKLINFVFEQLKTEKFQNILNDLQINLNEMSS